MRWLNKHDPDFHEVRPEKVRSHEAKDRILRVQPILNVAAQAVRAAGRELMARAPQAPSSRAISAASEAYLQRTHDRAMRSIERYIQKSYPDNAVLAAEDWDSAPADDMCWVVEPINGRVNFMRRLDHFCTLVAISINRRITHALIIDHFRDGQFQVTKNEGCYNNDGRMRVSNTRATKDAIVAFDESSSSSHFHQLEFATRLTGSFGLDVANVACGRYDAINCLRVSPFHFQFARLFIREAGGFASTLDGGEWANATDGLAAGNTYLYRKLVAERAKSQPVAAS